MASPREAQPAVPPVLGVLAGGQGRRMGGRDKAWLPAPGGREALIERLLRIADELGLPAVVVGGRAPVNVTTIADDPAGVGPLGALRALLVHAGTQPVIALACDLPYVDSALLAKLARASSDAAVLAPRDAESGKWQTLFARYQPALALPACNALLARGERSLQALLRAVEVEELPLSDAEHALLVDWDEPGDMAR